MIGSKAGNLNLKAVPESIAIIGLGCEFPGAHSPGELWENILSGRRVFRKAPPERLPPEYFDPNPAALDKSYCDLMAVLSDWSFDPVEFRIPPVTFQATDMAHWLALFTARAAVRDAGLKLEQMDRTRVGVVLGNSLTGEFSRSHNLRLRWPYVERSLRRALRAGGTSEEAVQKTLAATREIYEAPLPATTEDTLAGNMSNTIAGRICNYFDFGAGGFTVDGACSSSLLSVATACHALADGEMDVALAGGVDLSLDPFEIVGFAKTQALATDDIRPYDERAAGMLTGEGCGLVLLMRAADARAAGHPIRALIRGWGYSSDGAGGMTAPGLDGQLRALRRAYERAGYSIGTVGLIEGHGTGTSLGDKVELTALRRLLDEAPGATVCQIGSIKANIGHCKAAAGVAGLIKAVLALERKIIPPTVNCARPNPVFGVPLGRLRPSLEGRAWESGPTPRRASVSAMGFGGSNAHVTLEEANPEAAPAPEDLALLGSQQSSELIVLAANSVPELRESIEHLLPIARRICRAELTDLSAALAQKAAAGPQRLAIVAESPWGLAESLRACDEKLAGGAELSALNDPENGVLAGAAVDAPKLVALFPGQGSQRLNMGRHWRRRFPFIREFYECSSGAGVPPASVPTSASLVGPAGAATAPLPPLSAFIFRDVLSADDSTRQTWEAELRDTRLAQPAIVLSSLATLQVLQFFGLQPHFAIGHSLGEISALAAAGAWDADAAIRLAARRGVAMAALPIADGGGMVAVAARSGVVRELLELLSGPLVISNYNSPRQTVVSGPSEAIRKFVRLCEEKKLPCRPLPVSHAFHSPIVSPAVEKFREALLGGATFLSPQPANSGDEDVAAPSVISTVTGQFVSPHDNLPDYLAEQICRPVRFTAAVLRAVEERPSLWVEVGPGGALTSFVRDILSPVEVPCLPTDLADEDGFHLLNQVLGRAWVLGFPVKLERLFAHRFHRPLDAAHYHPRFIVNPCERPVELGARAAEMAETEPATPAPGLTGRASEDRETLLAFTIEWIAKRTGFPTSAINPEQRLRDDLNLDSIKVGELVVLLARKLNRQAEADPASFANRRIREVVDAVLGRDRHPESEVQATEPQTPPQEPTDSLGEWTRTFRMELVPTSLPGAGQAGRLSYSGTCVIVAEADCQRARAMAEQLGKQGFSPLVTDAESLLQRGDAPANLAALIVILPPTRNSFLACGPAEFDQRVEGTAETLFRVFRWAGHGRDAAALRGLVLRPAPAPEDRGLDLDGGSGFLKSLGLEYPEANFKWLTLPAEWPPERWAEVAAAELQATRDRVALAYTPDGERWSEAARLLIPSPPEPAVKANSSLPAADAPAPAFIGEWDTVFLLPDGKLRRTAPDDPALALGPDDVVLVSGGAKGITRELALALAQKTGARLALLGSSPPQDEVLQNLQRFRQLGLRHLYLQADVTDQAAVQRAVQEAAHALGPVTAILHGAGVSHLRAFHEKELGEFLQCLRVKARGLYNLLTAVSPARLKALHVISSVLGKTGMRGQADYTLANAWLASAVRAVKAAHPHVHCLSLGYTAWAETGLARRFGVVESLRSLGVRPITVAEGVAAYLELLEHPQHDGDCVITGRLTHDFEADLYAPPAPPRGRFLEQIQRWVPGVELIADATLSHDTDLYLAEHVFEGTPIFPGVMALEAMVQAAMVCAGRAEWPVLRDVQFHAPLIVPEDAPVVMRTLALAEAREDGGVCVQVAIRSQQDGFKQNHFAAECHFESAPSTPEEPAPRLPETWPAPLDQDPEAFSPAPLFQGKFFRRIATIRQLDLGAESWTEIQVPSGERYFTGLPSAPPMTSSPVVRDACLQSGALILPPGCLPSGIEELRLLGRATPETKVVCRAWVRSQNADEFTVDIAAFDASGRLLETMRHLRLQQTGRRLSTHPAAEPISPARVPRDLEALLPGTRQGLAFVQHDELQNPAGRPELAANERERLPAEAAEPRHASALANLAAVRRAVTVCARRADGVTLAHRPDGKPELRFADDSLARELQGADVSLADGGGCSVAWIGPAPVGVDLELVAARDTETWRDLLGDDGYALALRVAGHTAESFDCAATRVWTLLEAGRKASGLQRIVPRFDSGLGGPWFCFVGAREGREWEFLSTTLALSHSGSDTAALTVAFRRAATENSSSLGADVPAWPASFESLLADFRAGLDRLKLSCANDPQAPGTEDRHAEFLAVIETARQRLQPMPETCGAAELPALRTRFQQTVLEYLDGSENFRHTLVKPYGYAGDFQLLEMLARNRCASRGLAWHFDRSQLEYPASEACRQRISWIRDEIAGLLAGRQQPQLTILDLGIGAGPVEQELLRAHPGLTLRVQAVDLEPAALEYVVRALAGERRTIQPWRLNLCDPAALAEVSRLAAGADVCIAVGILEALGDADAERLLGAVLRSLPPGAVLFTENFLPTHPTRLVMEWFLDFHLCCRTLDELAALASRAGAKPSRMDLKIDPTQSLALLKATP